MNWNEHFLYEPKSGNLLWKTSRKGRGCSAGSIAGTSAHHGYIAVMLFGKKYYNHRVVWEMHFGEIPKGFCIDHIDGDKSNNKISNLRIATLSDNQRNRSLPSGNRVGIHGIYENKNGFSVQCAGKYIGYKSDFFDACCLRKSAEIQMKFHQNHGRNSQ